MTTETLTFAVRYRRGPQANSAELQVVRVEQGQQVYLKDSTFLLRVTIDERRSVEQCFIRHIASGREAYMSGGSELGAFVRECLLGAPAPVQPDRTGG